MYELRHFSTLCLKPPHETTRPKIQYSSIYDFHQVPVRRDVLHYLDQLPERLVNYYAVVYWSVLLMSVYGFVLTLNEMYRVAQGHKITPSFRVLHFNVFPDGFRRNVRLASAVVSAAITMALVVGVLMMKPDCMTPWLSVQLIVVVAEVILWLRDLWTDAERFSLRTFVAFCCVYVYWMAVYSVRQTFLVAASHGVRDGLAVIT